MGGWIAHKGEEGVGIFGQAFHRFRILGFVLLLETSQLLQSRVSAFGPHDFMQVGFRPWLESFGQLIEHVRDFVNPAALFICFKIDVAQSGPKAEGDIGDGHLGRWHVPTVQFA
jgi:hypothetical protein